MNGCMSRDPMQSSHKNLQHIENGIQEPPDYDQVRVLILHWEEALRNPDSDLIGLAEELEELAIFFKETMGYHVQKYGIPQIDATESTKRAIANFVEGLPERSLFILFYGGHGTNRHDDSDLRLLWSAKAWTTTNSSVNWTEAQKTVMCLPQDILIILDCCDAAVAPKDLDDHGGGRAEILAAVGMHTDALPPGPYSFTRRFMNAVREAVQSPARQIDTRALHGKISRNNNLTPFLRDLVEKNLPNIILRPQRSFSGNSNFNSIGHVSDIPEITYDTQAPGHKDDNPTPGSAKLPSADDIIREEHTILDALERKRSNTTGVVDNLIRNLEELTASKNFQRFQKRPPRFEYAQIRSNTRQVVVEYRPRLRSEDVQQYIARIQQLAERLSSLYVNIDLGSGEINILRCCGYAQRPHGDDYGLVFELPVGGSEICVPITLRQIIEKNPVGPPLEHVNALFKAVISTNSQLNSHGFQHGGITTEDVVFFSEDFRKPWIFGCNRRLEPEGYYKIRFFFDSPWRQQKKRALPSDPRTMGFLLFCIGLWKTESTLRNYPQKQDTQQNYNTEKYRLSYLNREYWKRRLDSFLARDPSCLQGQLANRMGTRYKLAANLLLESTPTSIEDSANCFLKAEAALAYPVEVGLPLEPSHEDIFPDS